MIKTLFNFASNAFSGITTKVLITICAILAGLVISAFIGLKHYEKSYKESLVQQTEIKARLNQTKVILDKQNEAIKKANADLQKYEGEIKKIKAQNAKKFAELEKRRIQTCNDLANGLVDLLKTYDTDKLMTKNTNHFKENN